MDWPVGALRPIYRYKNTYPSTVALNRGSTWHPSNLQGTPEQLQFWGNESIILHYIPQVTLCSFCFMCSIVSRFHIHMHYMRQGTA